MMYNIGMKEEKNILDDYITIKYAAEYIGVAPITLRRWDEAGKPKAKRHPMSRFRLYKKSDLDKILKEIEKS